MPVVRRHPGSHFSSIVRQREMGRGMSGGGVTKCPKINAGQGTFLPKETMNSMKFVIPLYFISLK